MVLRKANGARKLLVGQSKEGKWGKRDTFGQSKDGKWGSRDACWPIKDIYDPVIYVQRGSLSAVKQHLRGTRGKSSCLLAKL